MARKPPEKPRVVSGGDLGSAGDINDRFRNVYQPGAHPMPPDTTGPSLMQRMSDFFAKRKRSPSHVTSGNRGMNSTGNYRSPSTKQDKGR